MVIANRISYFHDSNGGKQRGQTVKRPGLKPRYTADCSIRAGVYLAAERREVGVYGKINFRE
jgi:hypothetical protein